MQWCWPWGCCISLSSLTSLSSFFSLSSLISASAVKSLHGEGQGWGLSIITTPSSHCRISTFSATQNAKCLGITPNKSNRKKYTLVSLGTKDSQCISSFLGMCSLRDTFNGFTKKMNECVFRYNWFLFFLSVLLMRAQPSPSPLSCTTPEQRPFPFLFQDALH